MSMTRRRLLDDTYKQTAVGNPIRVRSVARMRPEITMQGWTEQKKTTGAQLLQSIAEETKVINGITFEPISPTEIKIYGTAEQNADITGKYQDFKAGTYTLGVSEAVIGSRLRVCFTAKTGASSFDIPNLGASKTQELSEDISLAILVRVYAGTTINTTLKIMFNAGDVALPYEPYTGGAPSPSPDYPQEIVSAGDYNEETDKYEYEIKVTGKNILSIPDITPSTPERTIACNITRDITISAQEVPISISSNIWRLRMKYPDGTLLYFADVDFLSLKTKTFYASEENPIIGITYRPTYITEGRYGGIQVEYGTEATAYEPYKSQDITLTSDRPLTEWDRLERRDGVWGWVYKQLQKSFTGIENWENYNIGFKIPNVLPEIMKQRDGFCNQLKVGNNFNENTIWFGSSTGNTDIYIPNLPSFYSDELADRGLSNWRKHLSENPLVIQTYTDTSEFAPLQDSEQDALNALHTNYPTTVLSNEQRCGMSMIYKIRKSLEVSE